MKSINWSVSILNPTNNDILENKEFKNIEEIAKKYDYLPLSTWRNICLGRSKVYNKFICVNKNKVSLTPPLNDNIEQ